MVANNSSSGVGNHTVMGAQQGTQGCNLLGFSQYTHGVAKGHPQSSHGNLKHSTQVRGPWPYQLLQVSLKIKWWQIDTILRQFPDYKLTTLLLSEQRRCKTWQCCQGPGWFSFH